MITLTRVLVGVAGRSALQAVTGESLAVTKGSHRFNRRGAVAEVQELADVCSPLQPDCGFVFDRGKSLAFRRHILGIDQSIERTQFGGGRNRSIDGMLIQRALFADVSVERR